MPNVAYHKGQLIQNVHMVLIYWGTYWIGSNPDPSVQAINDAVNSIVSGTYMSQLSQYSKGSQTIRPGVLYQSVLITAPVGSSRGDPPNPFTDDNIRILVSDCIRTGTVQPPDDPKAGNNQILYCVILPPNLTSRDHPDFAGEHGSYTLWNFLWNHVVRYAWVRQDGTLDFFTQWFSHELVEACTDPDLASWYQDDDGQEIGDLCEKQPIVGRLGNGLLVQGYWSNNDNSCVIPL